MEWGVEKKAPHPTTPIVLEYEWVLWYDEGSPKGQSHADYESSMKLLGSFATVQDFWRYWNNIVDIDKFPDFSNLRMFKTGIKPMWEDKANVDGGKWVVPCATKEQTNCLMIRIVLAIIGEQFKYGDDLCGVVLSVRPKGDTINIWNRCGNDTTVINTTTAHLTHLVGDSSVKYQTHREAITYNKSYHAKSPKNSHSSHRVNGDDTPEPTSHGLNLSLSTGALLRGHLTGKVPPFLDLDDVKARPEVDVGTRERDLEHKNRIHINDNKEYRADSIVTEEKALPSLHLRHRDKQHKKSKSMSIVEDSCEYPSYSVPNSVRKIAETIVVPSLNLPMPMLSPHPVQSPPLSSTSFRKHKKSASVSVESPVTTHTKMHSRTPSSDAMRKHSSKSPLLTSNSLASLGIIAPSRISKTRLSPTLPLDTSKRIVNNTHGQRHKSAADRDLESYLIDFGTRPSSRLRRTSVDECIVDDVVVKELLGGVDEEDYDMSLVEDQFRPRAFAPVARRPSIKEDQTKALKRRFGSRKEHRNETRKRHSRGAFFVITAFLLEHLQLFGMILGICLITVVLQSS